MKNEQQTQIACIQHLYSQCSRFITPEQLRAWLYNINTQPDGA